MSPTKGWFESDDDYRSRVAREADERTIEDSTGSAPSKGWLENDDDYCDRISRESDEHKIEDSTGLAPSKGWFENDDDYRDRIHRESNERTIEDSTGSAPSKGWLESDDDYDTRIRKESNEQILLDGTGSASKKGWFEGDHDYRSRIAHEAREVRANERPSTSIGSNSDSSSSYDTDSSYSQSRSPTVSHSSSPATTGGFFWGAVVVIALIVIALLSQDYYRSKAAREEVTVNLQNNGCTSQDFYLSGKLITTIPAESSQSFSVTAGRYKAKACTSHTNNCGSAASVDWRPGTKNVFTLSKHPDCRNVVKPQSNSNGASYGNPDKSPRAGQAAPPTMNSASIVLGMGKSQNGFERNGSTGYVYWHGRLLDDKCLSEKSYVLLPSPANRYIAGFCSLTGRPDISPSRLLDNQSQKVVYSGFGCMFGNGTPDYSWLSEDILGSATCHINVADLMNHTEAANIGNENADSAMLKDANNTLDKLLKQ